MKANVKYYKLRIFPARVGIVFDCNIVNDEIKRFKADYDEIGKNYYAGTYKFLKNGRLYCLVYLNKNKSKTLEIDADTIAHETYHVVVDIMEHMEENNPGEETNAYLTGYITQIFIKELIKEKYNVSLL